MELEEMTLGDLKGLIAFYEDFIKSITLVNAQIKVAIEVKEWWLQEAGGGLEKAKKELQKRGDRV